MAPNLQRPELGLDTPVGGQSGGRRTITGFQLQEAKKRIESVSLTLTVFFNLLFIAWWWLLQIPIPASLVAAIVLFSLATHWFVVRRGVAGLFARTEPRPPRPQKDI